MCNSDECRIVPTICSQCMGKVHRTVNALDFQKENKDLQKIKIIIINNEEHLNLICGDFNDCTNELLLNLLHRVGAISFYK